jgi:hypothetical protein
MRPREGEIDDLGFGLTFLSCFMDLLGSGAVVRFLLWKKWEVIAAGG